MTLKLHSKIIVLAFVQGFGRLITQNMGIYLINEVVTQKKLPFQNF